MLKIDVTIPRDHFNIVVNGTFNNGITGIFGTSGSGKTTLLKSISGIVKPVKGKITIDHKVLFDNEANINIAVEKRKVGYVFQDGRLFPHMDVERNLLYGFKKDASNVITLDEVTELLELGDLLTRKPSQISGGESQRVALGRSILSSPEILLLDEPFSAVDFNLRNQIIPFISSIQTRLQIPVLVVSHDLPDLLKLTQKLLVLQKGTMIGYGDYEQLINQKELSNFLSM